MRLLSFSALFLLSCATVNRPKMETCLPHPGSKKLVCTDKEGQPKFVPFEETQPYVCFPLDDFEAYAKSCGRAK